MSKPSSRILVLLTLALCLALYARPTAAQDHGTGASHAPVPHSTEGVADNVGHAADPNAHGAADAGHAEGDHRLVPIPPSRDTMMSALWVIIIFLVLLAILYPTAWKNVLAGLRAREERIRKDIADAEAARSRAEATLRDYNTKLTQAQAEVQAMLAQATQQAERIAANIRAQAQTESEETKAKALRDIDAARREAVADVHTQAADLATAVAAKILRRNLNPDDQRDLVNQSLEQLQAVGVKR